MNQKLTLSIEAQAIDRGKRYAKKSGRSLSSLVETFLLLLDTEKDEIVEQIPVSNKLASLVGIGAGPVNEADYKRHVLERNDA